MAIWDNIQRMTNVRKKKHADFQQLLVGDGQHIRSLQLFRYSIDNTVSGGMLLSIECIQCTINESNLIINAIDTIVMFLSQSSISLCVLPGTLLCTLCDAANSHYSPFRNSWQVPGECVSSD